MDRQEMIRRLDDILDESKKKIVLGYFRVGSLEDLTDERLAFTIGRQVPADRLKKEETLLSKVDPEKRKSMYGFYGVSDIWKMTDEQLDDAISKKTPIERSYRKMFPNIPALMKPLRPMVGPNGVNVKNVERMYRFVRHLKWERKKALESGWDREYIDKNIPEVEFPREFLAIVTENRDGILDKWGLDEEKKNLVYRWEFASKDDKQIAKYSSGIGATLFVAFRNFEWTNSKDDDFSWDFRTKEEKTMDAFVDINRNRLLAKKAGNPLPHFPEALCRRLCDLSFMDLAKITDEARARLLALTSYGNNTSDLAVAMAYKDSGFAKQRIKEKTGKAVPRSFVTPGSTLREILKELRAENGEIVMYHQGKRLLRPEFSGYLSKTCTDDRFLNEVRIDLSSFKGKEEKELQEIGSGEGRDAVLAGIERWKRRIAFLETKGSLDEQIAKMDENSKRSLAFFFTKGIQPALVRRIREEKLEKLGVDMDVMALYFGKKDYRDLTLEQLDKAYDMKCRQLGIDNSLHYSVGNKSAMNKGVYYGRGK